MAQYDLMQDDGGMLMANRIWKTGESRLAMWFILIVALIACAMLLPGCSSSDSGNAAVAAQCEGVTVTEGQVSDYTAAFRQGIEAVDDEAWARYLRGQHLDAKSWRENAIRQIAVKQLVENRAQELGIVADESQIETSIAKEKSDRGLAAGDDEAWAAALASEGTTPDELRSQFEYASILEQVILHDEFSDEEGDGEKLQSYIEQSLMDRVLRRYSVLSFDSNEQDAAVAAFEELDNLKNSELTARFDEMVAERSSQSESSGIQGDIGWDLLYDLSDVIDPAETIKLQPGDLYPGLVERDEGWQIYLCTGRFVFESGVQYTELEESLQKAIARANLVASWSRTVTDYTTQIVDDANIQVTQMPKGLPYDVDDIMAKL